MSFKMEAIVLSVKLSSRLPRLGVSILSTWCAIDPKLSSCEKNSRSWVLPMWSLTRSLVLTRCVQRWRSGLVVNPHCLVLTALVARVPRRWHVIWGKFRAGYSPLRMIMVQRKNARRGIGRRFSFINDVGWHGDMTICMGKGIGHTLTYTRRLHQHIYPQPQWSICHLWCHGPCSIGYPSFDVDFQELFFPWLLDDSLDWQPHQWRTLWDAQGSCRIDG